ncbi:hypothetical protein AbraIFM66951_010061 [Aspergillus brasiliensis]|nr:hypothetical protein AbraIFM66951_010061 [Aspergillus brasiliensis]
MKLRSRIHPPNRFSQDQYYSPCTQRSLRGAQNQDCIYSTQFDPNLPPAAFPTLDYPSPLSLHNKETGHRDEEDASLSSSPSEQMQADGRSENKSVGKENSGVHIRPPESGEDCIASNGDLNPVYRRNMAVFASIGRESSIERDMMDSDLDEDNMETSSATLPVRSRKWSGLSPRFQVEIIDNMLQDFTWPTVCHLLGLTAKEREETQQNIRKRDQQTKQEDIQLEAMRERQLRALLRVDNSIRGHNRVSHQGLFSKISRQVSGKLQADPDSDFSLCRASELLDARSFLRMRGIDRKYAGDWSNGTSAWQAFDDHDNELCPGGETQQHVVDEMDEVDETVFDDFPVQGNEDDNVPGSCGNCTTLPNAIVAKYCPNLERNRSLHEASSNRPGQCPRHKVVYWDLPGSEPCRLSVGVEKAAHVCDTRWGCSKLVSTSWEMPLKGASNEKPRPILGSFHNNQSNKVNKVNPKKSQNAALVPSTRLSYGDRTDRRAAQTLPSPSLGPRHGTSAPEVHKEAPHMPSSENTYVTLSDSRRTSSPRVWSPKATPNNVVFSTNSDCLPTDDSKQQPRANKALPFLPEARKDPKGSVEGVSGHEVAKDDPWPVNTPKHSGESKEDMMHASEEISDGDNSSEDSAEDDDDDEVVLLPV